MLSTLEKTVEGYDRSKAIEASGLLTQIKSFQFLLCLLLFKKIFYVTAKPSDVLQAEKLDFAATATFIEATINTLKSFRTEDERRKVYDEARALAVSLRDW